MLPVPYARTIDIDSNDDKTCFGDRLLKIGSRDARYIVLARLAAIDEGDGLDGFDDFPLLGQLRFAFVDLEELVERCEL